MYPDIVSGKYSLTFFRLDKRIAVYHSNTGSGAGTAFECFKKFIELVCSSDEVFCLYSEGLHREFENFFITFTQMGYKFFIEKDDEKDCIMVWSKSDININEYMPVYYKSRRPRSLDNTPQVFMTPTGQISMYDVREELKLGGQISLNDARVRKLAKIPRGQISLADLRGKQDILIYEFTPRTYDGGSPYASWTYIGWGNHGYYGTNKGHPNFGSLVPNHVEDRPDLKITEFVVITSLGDTTDPRMSINAGSNKTHRRGVTVTFGTGMQFQMTWQWLSDWLFLSSNINGYNSAPAKYLRANCNNPITFTLKWFD